MNLGSLEGTANGKPWVDGPKRGNPRDLYAPGPVYALRPHDFYWTCYDGVPYSEGCELDDNTVPTWCKDFVIDTVIDAYDFGEDLDDEVEEDLRLSLWDDL